MPKLALGFLPDTTGVPPLLGRQEEEGDDFHSGMSLKSGMPRSWLKGIPLKVALSVSFTASNLHTLRQRLVHNCRTIPIDCLSCAVQPGRATDGADKGNLGEEAEHFGTHICLSHHPPDVRASSRANLRTCTELLLFRGFLLSPHHLCMHQARPI